MRPAIPPNALAFEKRFRTERSCRLALLRTRWPDGFACPRCGSPRYFELRSRPVIECARCKKQVSLLAGTLFHAAKLPLTLLFRLVYLVVAEKSGTNACALSRQVGVSYPTALLWMRKVRDAMSARRRTRLNGEVEVDETIVGGKQEGSRGRRLGKKLYVVVMAEDRGDDGIGRIRLRAAERADGKTLGRIVRSEVEKGSLLRTDGWSPYRRLADEGYGHVALAIEGSGEPAHVRLPLVHLVASLLKRYLRGTFHGSTSRRWLQTMLWEFEYRFNRRRSGRRPLLFFRLLESGVRQRPRTRDQLEAACALL